MSVGAITPQRDGYWFFGKRELENFIGFGGVAQAVEHLLCKQEALSSNPSHT
jgi:hypothetical protein